jgi:hypothetical protein
VLTELLGVEIEARPILSSHVRKLDRSLGKSDIIQLLQQTRKGQVMMANWDPTHQTTVFEPDLDFARDLCERGEWRALAVYARQWTEQSFLAGDSTGLYWLSISFRRLGFKDAADAALEFGLRLHGFFEGRLDPRNAEA